MFHSDVGFAAQQSSPGFFTIFDSSLLTSVFPYRKDFLGRINPKRQSVDMVAGPDEDKTRRKLAQWLDVLAVVVCNVGTTK